MKKCYNSAHEFCVVAASWLFIKHRFTRPTIRNGFKVFFLSIGVLQIMSDTNLSSQSFDSKFRNIFWPIHNFELGKFIPMSMLMFCILFNQNILRIMKDSILISEVSAEVTSFTKVYCVTPMAAIFVVIYAKMINHMIFSRIFYYLISIFTSFFIVFAFLIYPSIDSFHMDRQNLHYLMDQYPHLKWYIAGIANWSYVLFYTLAELWPNIFYILLFWQLANEITTTNQAKRFYTLFAMIGNSSLIVVGIIMMNLAGSNSALRNMFTTSEHKIILTKAAISMVAISSMVSCLLMRHITKNVMSNPSYNARAKSDHGSRAKMGVIDSFKYIARSKYLWLMVICSASFGLSMNLVEAVWKAKIKDLYPSVNDFAAFNAMYILWTGVAIILMTIIGNNAMRRSSWFSAAVISPIVILITGFLFFVLVVCDDKISTLLDGIILISPLALAVATGAIQNILSKGVKYALWDTSKEMLYIPLDPELRSKGKAAVDVISSKIGKSASGLVQSIIFTIIPMATYQSIAPALMIIFVSVCVLWIYAVKKVYLEYQKIA